MECIGAKNTPEILPAQIPHIAFIALIYPEGGTAKLFVGVAENDVTVNIKGGAPCNNTKQLAQASSLVIILIQFLP